VASDAAVQLKADLEAAISACDDFVALIGPTTATSSWVTWEIEQARAAHKRILIARGSAGDAVPPAADGCEEIAGSNVDAIVAALGREA
jgi:hypothetical protein